MRLKQVFQRIDQAQFIFNRQFNIQMFNSVRIVPQPIQRNHHVFINFEGIGVLGNRCRAGTVQPEFFTCISRDCDKPFPVARIGEPHDLASGLHHGIFIIRNNVTNQHHFRTLIAS